MDDESKRPRGAGAMVRNTKGEPVGVRVRHPTKGRITVFFRPSHGPVPEDVAEQKAAEIVELAKNAAPDGEGLTVTEWWKDYLDAAGRGEVGRKTRGRPQVTVAARRARFAKYIAPFIGTRPIAQVTPDELRPIVANLDKLSRLRLRFYAGEVGRDEKKNTKPGLSPKTAANVWGEVTSGFREACSSKLDELRVRSDSPATGVQGPDSGANREQTALYPSELDALLSCERVPVYRRQLYALCAYTGLRQSEARGLCGSDVDFEHGVIHVRRQHRDGDKRATTRTKTRAGRRDIPIEAALVPLLEVLVERADGGPLVRVPPAEDCAELVRRDLRAAGCEREELLLDDEEHHHFTLHGLRHTCLTHWAVAGRAMQWIQAAAGHTDWQVTQGYVDAAAVMRATFGTPHPTIPGAVLAWPEVGPDGRRHPKNTVKSATPMGIEPMLPA